MPGIAKKEQVQLGAGSYSSGVPHEVLI